MKSDRPIRMKQAVREIERQGEREREISFFGKLHVRADCVVMTHKQSLSK